MYYTLRKHKYKILIPQPPTGAGLSESSMPRICAAPSIEQCLMAIGTNTHTFHVYQLDEDPDVIEPECVWDAHWTGEVWYFRPVVPIYLGTHILTGTHRRPCGCGSMQPVGLCSSPYGWEYCG